MQPTTLPEADAEVIAGLLAACEVPDEPDVEHPPLRNSLGRASFELFARDLAGAPRLRLLGVLRVEGAAGRAESARIGRLAETAAFIHLNPGARPSQLQSALWPGRPSNTQTCRQMISRTRTWLGRDESGAPHLLHLSEAEGRLRLGAAVTSDWQDFQRLASIGLADPADIDHLTAALSMVRGRPFGPLAAKGIGWAELHIDQMLCVITDVAHELASRHLASGRADLARAAALRGLVTECESVALERLAAEPLRRGA